MAGIHAPGPSGVVHYLHSDLPELYREVRAKRFSTLVECEFDPDTREVKVSRRLTPIYRHENKRGRVQTAIATEPGSGEGRTNEDWVAASPLAAVVLDGVSSPTEMGTGCVHDVPWYVRQLGSRILLEVSTNSEAKLTDCLASAIRKTADAHAITCDLDHPGTPMATVAILREQPSEYEYLVLSDAVIVLDGPAGVKVITDDTVEQIAREEIEATRRHPTGTPEHRQAILRLVDAQRALRNIPGGYWLAAANPDAAHHAQTGTIPRPDVTRAAVLTDGTARLAEPFRVTSWTGVLDMLEHDGPGCLLTSTRRIENTDPTGERWPRYKRSDDATVAFVSNDAS